MRTTGYFREQVLRKRDYIKEEWCTKIIDNPIYKEAQPDGRIRYWGYVESLQKYLRVVTLSDEVKIHNVFPDRRFREDKK